MSSSGYFLKNAQTGVEIALDKPSVSLGRSTDSDIVLDGGLPSRNHARLLCTDKGIEVEDLASSNGTFVNETRLDPEKPLLVQPGDKLRFDIEEYLLCEKNAGESDKTMVRPAVVEDKTSVRPAVSTEEVSAAAVPIEPAVQEKTVAAADTPTPVKEEKQAVRPGAWADPDAASAVEGHTIMIDKNKLKNLMENELSSLDVLDEEVDTPALIITSGGQSGLLFKLEIMQPGEASWLIGSDEASDIQLEEGNVSARHAKLTCNNGRWQLSDQMTVNGTFVNGKKCTISYLNSGDRLTFGSVTALFKMPGKQKKPGRKAGAVKHGEKKPASTIMVLGISFVATLLVAAAGYFLFLR